MRAPLHELQHELAAREARHLMLRKSNCPLVSVDSSTVEHQRRDVGSVVCRLFGLSAPGEFS